MNSKSNNRPTRSAAKHGGNKKRRFVRSRAGVDWMFRRLKNQAALFLARNTAERRKLAGVLKRTKTYHALRMSAKRVAGPAKWERFLDRFYAHRIMRPTNGRQAANE